MSTIIIHGILLLGMGFTTYQYKHAKKSNRFYLAAFLVLSSIFTWLMITD